MRRKIKELTNRHIGDTITEMLVYGKVPVIGFHRTVKQNAGSV